MKHSLLLLLLFPALAYAAAGAGEPVRPLAQDHVVLAESPYPKTNPMYNPTILALPNGRLIGGYVLSGNGMAIPNSGMYIFTSDDGGVTWQQRLLSKKTGQARLFLANGVVYLIGSASTMYITKSTDNGSTWSTERAIMKAGWHQSATNFLRAKSNIYLVTEKRVDEEIKGWKVGELSPVLMRAKETDDLSDPASWTFSPDFQFKDIIPGYRENDLALGPFAIPFFPQTFPNPYQTDPTSTDRNSACIGWLESNIAQITDPGHPWYDPEGKTFHVLMRAHTGGTGYAALAKVVENADGSLETSLERSPSGEEILYLPMPGGQMRFHISHDEQTGLHWLLSSQAIDSMTRSHLLPKDRYGLPNNERHRLVLHFSEDLIHWQFAGVVAIGDSPRYARHYAAMDIDGDDLVILSRSADAQAKSTHDGNLITFHRVRNFRSLVY